jgi:GNAT superfamily N-acetyltransferase
METDAHAADPEVIRPGRVSDAPLIADLIRRENGRPADADEIARCLAAEPGVVAVAGDRIVGMIYARRFSPDIVEWRNSLVASDRRRTGLGRRLVAAMESACVDAGYRAAIGVNCWLHRGATRERAATARAFWLAMGWSIVFATDGSAVVARHF